VNEIFSDIFKLPTDVRNEENVAISLCSIISFLATVAFRPLIFDEFFCFPFQLSSARK